MAGASGPDERSAARTGDGLPRGQVPGISPSLKRLVDDPRRLGTISLWRALGAEAREAAARAYLSADDGGRENLSRVVAEARNFRPATVGKWPVDRIAAAIRFAPIRDHAVALRLLQCHHVPGQLPMVTAFLDALGVSHDEGSVGSFGDVDASGETVKSAVAGLVREYGLDSVAVYLLALRLFRAPAGEKGRTCLLALLTDSSGEAAREPDTSPPGEADPVEARGEEIQDEHEDPTRQRSFTTLDRLMIHAAVDSAQGIEGALDADELDDVVDELVKLNGRRHQSYFHAGFRDVLFDRPVAGELPAENQSRLRWYWTGAVQGWARRGRWNRIVREHAENPVVKELGSGRDAASVAAVGHVVEALRREGRTAEIARFVRVPALVGQPRLFKLLLDAATELLGKGDAASALPVFDLLLKTRGELERMGVPATERLLLDAHRRMAHCLRHLHHYARARTMLEDLLTQEPDPNIHAMAHADLGLMEGGFDGLEEVVLPLRTSELDGFLDRLTRGVEDFRRSVDTETTYSAHGHYCLGVLALGRAVSDNAFEDAERHLQHARVHFSEAADSYPRQVVEHASLYFGIAKAQQLSPNKLAHAADVIADSLASGARMPESLIEPTLEALGLAEEKKDLRRVADALLDTGGDAELDRLAACDAALDHCPVIADRLAVRADVDGRPASDRAADLRSALRGFRQRGDRTAMGETLDRLDWLAHRDIAVPEFLELLEDRASYDPAWELEDATIARARCYEDREDFLEALAVLRKDLFFRFASPERGEAGLNDAAGLLARIRGYGIDPSHYSDMTSRYEALAEQAEDEAPTEPHAAAPVRVLVVGGAELQAKAEGAVHEELAETLPHIRVRFIPTGWGQNWSRTLVEIRSEMESHDALVILRFMRTHLGREIRRAWDGPWRSCWAGSAGAIADSVSRVAAVVGSR